MAAWVKRALRRSLGVRGYHIDHRVDGVDADVVSGRAGYDSIRRLHSIIVVVVGLGRRDNNTAVAVDAVQLRGKPVRATGARGTMRVGASLRAVQLWKRFAKEGDAQRVGGRGRIGTVSC